MKRVIWMSALGLAAIGVIGAGVAVWARVPEALVSGHMCSDAAARFAQKLNRDAVLNQPPSNAEPVVTPRDPFQPCEGNGDNRYYGGALKGWEYPEPYLGGAAIEQHYRQLGAANGWEIVQHKPGELWGHKIIDDTAVVFHLSGVDKGEHDDAFWVELRFEDLGSHRYLC